METSKENEKRDLALGAEDIEFYEIDKLRKSLEEKYSHLPDDRKKILIDVQIEAFLAERSEVVPESVAMKNENLSLIKTQGK